MSNFNFFASSICALNAVDPDVSGCLHPDIHFVNRLYYETMPNEQIRLISDGKSTFLFLSFES